MSVHPVVTVEGITIAYGENAAEVYWRQHLHVKVIVQDALPDLSHIMPICQDNLEFREPTLRIDGNSLEFSVKPPCLGPATLRLIIIQEPYAKNEILDYRFELIQPFALPDQESVGKFFAQVNREDLRNAILKSISQPRVLSSHSSSLRAYCGGIWVSGPLCSGKTTLVSRICEYLNEFSFLVMRDTKLYEKEEEVDSPIVGEAAQGKFLASGSLHPSISSSFTHVRISDKEGWVLERDIVKVRPVKLNWHSLLNKPDYQPLSADIRVYSEIMKLLGVKQAPIVTNGHSQILAELVRLNQHILIVLDEYDRMQLVNSRVALQTLVYLKELVERVAEESGKFGLTLLVIDHKLPRERNVLPTEENFWQEHKIGFFSLDELSTMMKEVFENPKDILSPETLYRHTKGHPLFVNLFLYLCLQHLNDLDKPIQFEKLKSLVVHDESITKNVISWWVSEAKIEIGGGRNQANKRLTPREKTVLQNLVRMIPLGPGFETEIMSLRSKGLIHPNRVDFRFPLLRAMLTEWERLLHEP